MRYVSKSIEIDIDLSDFDSTELIQELQERGTHSVLSTHQERLLHDLYLDYVNGKNTDKSVKAVLDELYMYVPLRSV